MASEIEQLSRRVLALDEPGRPFELPNTTDRFVAPIQAPTDPLWALRQAVNVKCDVLLVGRIESGGAASLVLQAASDRLVLAAVDADNVVAGITKLIDFGADRDALAERLRAALGQRLPRKLCVDCREPYRPNAEALKRANLSRPSGDVLYRAKPGHAPDCATCHDVGYVGCSAIFEWLDVSARMRHLLRVGAGEREMLLEARKEGAVSSTEGALALLAAGETSADELRRVLQSARSDREDA
jgi:type II secretory ATPase GspE/PulE/Tfp pilus assembly ATPase PilB-like protein